MTSISKKRPKPKSSGSSNSSLKSVSLWEPPDDLFPSKDDIFRLVTAVAIAVSVFLSCSFFFSARHPKPFCDSASDASDFLSDNCEPCPNNGQCYQGKLECVRGYRKHGNLCVEDGDINQTAKKLSQWVQLRLCESYAQYLCGGTGMIWVPENDMWSVLDGDKLTEYVGSYNAVNNYTKHKGMETIGKVLETRTNSQGVREFKCPDVLVESYKPFSCRVHQWISNNVLVILPVCVLIAGFLFLVMKVRQRLYLLKRVDELYQQVCEILEENALTSKGRKGELESWVVASRLRDHLLSPKERKKPALWKMVEELVQGDSRVERYPKLVKGESKVVWEWQVEGSLSSTRMRQKGEESKLKSPASIALSSDQHHPTLKTETKGLLY
ncbi:uncharacterized protein LOC21406095 [Morus notabilis]|uniref:uncharacterized protein LOC21406095 n=1 Tax=Morus notabilis TaxID=981085 RepID=UPI000CED66CC|nr:uncharacterized protein LOC21406095 [Morus notabilis]